VIFCIFFTGLLIIGLVNPAENLKEKVRGFNAGSLLEPGGTVLKLGYHIVSSHYSVCKYCDLILGKIPRRNFLVFGFGKIYSRCFNQGPAKNHYHFDVFSK
jgi:hypothetical protein